MATQDYLTMNPGEEVILEAHRHWINVFPFFVSTTIVIAFGFFIISYVGTNAESAARLFPGLSIGVVTPLVALLDVVALLVLFFAYIVYRQNRIILTNMHFVQITQTGLFGRTLSKLSLDELQDVRGTRKGVFGTILNYGEILIETAGSEENFFFRPAPDPLNIAESINDTHEFYEKAMHTRGGLSDEAIAAEETALAAKANSQEITVPKVGKFPEEAFSDTSSHQQPPTQPTA